jgi:hypothetical protein
MDVVTFPVVCKKGIGIGLIVLTVRRICLLGGESLTVLRIALRKDAIVGQFIIVGTYVNRDLLAYTNDFIPDGPTIASGAANALIDVVVIGIRVVPSDWFTLH